MSIPKCSLWLRFLSHCNRLSLLMLLPAPCPWCNGVEVNIWILKWTWFTWVIQCLPLCSQEPLAFPKLNLNLTLRITGHILVGDIFGWITFLKPLFMTLWEPYTWEVLTYILKIRLVCTHTWTLKPNLVWKVLLRYNRLVPGVFIGGYDSGGGFTHTECRGVLVLWLQYRFGYQRHIGRVISRTCGVVIAL